MPCAAILRPTAGKKWTSRGQGSSAFSITLAARKIDLVGNVSVLLSMSWGRFLAQGSDPVRVWKISRLQATSPFLMQVTGWLPQPRNLVRSRYHPRTVFRLGVLRGISSRTSPYNKKGTAKSAKDARTQSKSAGLDLHSTASVQRTVRPSRLLLCASSSARIVRRA